MVRSEIERGTMKVIGLTGGIATGKSTVSKYLAEKGIPIIDADIVSRQVTEKGSPALDMLAEKFGSGIINEDGTLDRKGLGDIVFSDPEKRTELNNILHKSIMDSIDEQVSAFRKSGEHPIAVVDAALLIESGFDRKMDKVWVVVADMDVRIKRIMTRDDVTAEFAEKKIASQLSDEERIRKADEVINNSGTVEELKEQVDRLLEKYFRSC